MPEYHSGRTYSNSSGYQEAPITPISKEQHQKLLDKFGERVARSKAKDKTTEVEYESLENKSVEHSAPVKEQQSFQQYAPPELEPQNQSQSISLVERGEQAYQQKDYATAYDIYSEVVKLEPNNYKAWFHLEVSAVKTDNHAVAIEASQKLIDSGKYMAQAYYFQGLSYEELGHKPEAAIAYSKAGAEIPEAKSAFMRLEQERLFGGFSTDRTTSKSDTVKTQKKPESTSKSKETSNPRELQSSKSFSKATLSAPSNIGELNSVQKLVKAVEYAILELPAEIAEDVRAVLSPGAIASMAGIFAAYAASHAAGIGFIADAAFLLAGVAFLGRQIVGVVKDLIGFSQAVNATTEKELQQAGKHLANAVSTVGISVVMAILTKKTLSKIQRNVNNEQVRSNPDRLPNSRGGGEITTRGGGEIAPSGRGNSPRLPPVVPAPQLPTTSSTSGANSLSTRVTEQFGELSNLDSATVSTLDGLDDAALAGLGSSLETIAPDIKGQYLNIIALEPSKGQALIEFRNFETPERFLNVFNAIDSTADVRLIESIFGDAYLKATEVADPSKPYLSNSMQTRYELLLEEVASGSLNAENLEYSTSFTERLQILAQIKEVRTELYERLGAQPYKSRNRKGFGIISRNVAYGRYSITNANDTTNSITGDFLSISGYNTDNNTGNNKLIQKLESDEINDKTIVPDVVNESREVFEPKPEKVDGNPAQDSERKVLESIASQMETEWNEQFNPKEVYPNYEGNVEINSEMLPCESCQDVIKEQFKKMFPNINLDVKYGVSLDV